MKRSLRIAVSVFFALVAMAFAVLWAVSNAVQVWGYVPLPGENSLNITSICDHILLGMYSDEELSSPNMFINYGHVDEDDRKLYSNLDGKWAVSVPIGTMYRAPHWVFVLVCLIAAGLPFARNSFSLRTLLIATTVVAVILGLAVWASR
jgi:hypothetical protein